MKTASPTMAISGAARPNDAPYVCASQTASQPLAASPKSVSSAAPATGSSISYTLAVTNASGSPATATGVTVLDTLPAGFSFTNATGFGSYNSSTGVWTVGIAASGNAVGLSRADFAALAPADRDSRIDQARQRLYDAGAHQVIDTIADLPAILPAFSPRWTLGAAGPLPPA